MASAEDVLFYLRPNGGWVIRGEDYEGIEFLEAEPFTKQEFLAAFDLADEAKAQAQAEATANRQALLKRLGITEEEARLLLG